MLNATLKPVIVQIMES